MLKKIAASLLCSVAPLSIYAEPVELASPDGFISVEGEVVGFNGTMLSVQTSVGLMAVPASEVICFGENCLTLIEDNSFGLTEAALQGVVASPPTAATDELSDDFAISFDGQGLDSAFTTLWGAFAVAGGTATRVDTSTQGQITLGNEEANAQASLRLGAEDADLEITDASLNGVAEMVFGGPGAWARAQRPSHQMIGLNALSVITAPDIGIDVLSVDHLASIYAGELTNWSQLGGADQKILPLQLPTNSAGRADLVRMVMEPFGRTIAADVLTMADEAAIASTVEIFPGSISVIRAGQEGDVTPIAVSGSCGIPVALSEFSIVSGDYPLVHPTMVTYASDPQTTLMTELFDFASAPIAQNLLEDHGFINLGPLTQNTLQKNERINAVLQMELSDIERPVAGALFQNLFGAERLSTTLIGGAVSGPEAAWNRAMFGNLSRALTGAAYAGKEIMFVAFSNSVAGSQGAIDASSRDAAAMQIAFADFAGDAVSNNNISLSAFGFGALVPPTCIDSQVGGDSNSRVEIWIR